MFSEQKPFLTFRKWKFSYISGKAYSEPCHNGISYTSGKVYFYILENGTFTCVLGENFQGGKNEKKKILQMFLIFQEMELSSPKLKKSFLYFKKEHTKPKKQTKDLFRRTFLFLVMFL